MQGSFTRFWNRDCFMIFKCFSESQCDLNALCNHKHHFWHTTPTTTLYYVGMSNFHTQILKIGCGIMLRLPGWFNLENVSWYSCFGHNSCVSAPNYYSSIHFSFIRALSYNSLQLTWWTEGQKRQLYQAFAFNKWTVIRA